MTAQRPDRVFMEGEEGRLMARPLWGYFDWAEVPRPTWVVPDTATGDGHVAEWTLGEDLVLTGLTAWVDRPGGGIAETRDRDALPALSLPQPARWFSGQFRVGFGAEVVHVHGGLNSRYEREVEVTIEQGRVTATSPIAPLGPLGSAGPFQIVEGLLGELSGGTFASVYLARDADGAEYVAKVPRPQASPSNTEIWVDTAEGLRPVHVPATPFSSEDGYLQSSAVDGHTLREILVAESTILERDAGRLLPGEHGLWTHDPSGSYTLVMERLTGHSPDSGSEIRDLLAAVADAVDRGVFDAHGDLKPEHVFIASDGRVRVCDPAPRWPWPEFRAFTPAFNPYGRSGPAADVTACAAMLRLLPAEAGQPGWAWANAVFDRETPPPWLHDHRAALEMLDAELADPLPPPGPPPPIPDRDLGAAPSVDPWAPPPPPPPPQVASEPDFYPAPTAAPSPGDNWSVDAGLSAQLPTGWSWKESITLMAGDGQANVIASSEALDPSITSDQYARVQGKLLRESFSGYREIASSSAVVLGDRPGWSREFIWTPPDGHPVRQIQLYYAAGGRGYTVTATTSDALFVQHESVLREVLSSVVAGRAPAVGGEPAESSGVASSAVGAEPLTDQTDLFPLVGHQTMSAQGGGGGSIAVHATRETLDMVEIWLESQLREARHRGATVVNQESRRWRVQTSIDGWTSSSSMSVVLRDPATGGWSAPCPVEGVPADATCLIVRTSVSTPDHPLPSTVGPDRDGPGGRWRRRKR